MFLLRLFNPVKLSLSKTPDVFNKEPIVRQKKKIGETGRQRV